MWKQLLCIAPEDELKNHRQLSDSSAEGESFSVAIRFPLLNLTLN